MQKDMIKKIFLGVLIISVFGVLAIQLWEYIKQYFYINYENTNKIGLSILISTIFAVVIYIYWCIKSSEDQIIPITFIVFSIFSTIAIMIIVNCLVLPDVWRAIIIEVVFKIFAVLFAYIIASNL